MAITLAFLGDVMLGRGVAEAMRTRRPEEIWGSALPTLRAADAVIANLECAITGFPQRWMRTPKAFHFGAEPRAVEALHAANIRCVSLANNHILDYRAEGLAETIHRLERAGIAHAGAGGDAAEAAAPALFTVGDLKIGFISITDNEPPFAAGAASPGTCYMPIRLDDLARCEIQGSIASARASGANFIVLSLHWGPNMVAVPPPAFCEFARACLEWGVDVIHGHSAHVFQAVEPRPGGLIMYDTGDFLDDYAIDPHLHNDWSFMHLLDVERGKPARLRLIPVQLSYAQVDLATGGRAEEICRCMINRCAGFHSPLERTDEGLTLMIQSAAPDERATTGA